ncbi:MAG TPA: YceH family protein [Solirubrobacterales bacterium]
MEEPDATEIRVLGCLIEKQRTTPDVYPLSLNALRIACNQSTNRDPVVDYDEETVREALRRLALRGWTRLASGSGSRARKYRHLFDDTHTPDETALLAVLMLRGVQTPGELKQRTERMEGFADLAAVNESLEKLIARGAVERLTRRPGQKEERYRHLLGGNGGGDSAAHVEAAEESPSPPSAESQPQDDRLSRLEAEVADLRRQVAALREALDEQ